MGRQPARRCRGLDKWALLETVVVCVTFIYARHSEEIYLIDSQQYLIEELYSCSTI
jgi:hypothetical protein